MPFNLKVDAGTTFRFPFWIENEDESPVDLTGASAEMMVRRSYDSPTVNLHLTSQPGGGLEITSASGRIDIEITVAQSRALSTSAPLGDKYVYDVKLTLPGGDKDKALGGNLIVEPEVTKP